MSRCASMVLLLMLAATADSGRAWQTTLAGTPPDARPFALGVDASGNVYTGGRTASDGGFSAGNDANACTGDDRCLAGVCAGGPALPCDDRDACTLDRCDTATGCLHVAASGYASVLCVFERTTVAVACGDSLPQALVTRLAKTLPQLEKASTATRPRAACLRLRRGGRIARGAQRLATRARHQGRVPFDCAQAAVDAMTDLRARISALREEQC